MSFNTIILSHATYLGPSGATAAATGIFFTSDYEPPSQERAIDKDVVINSNGKFKYVYDNGPGFRRWSPFKIHCEEAFKNANGGLTAAQQYSKLLEMWEHPGNLLMKSPDGTYPVHWSDSVERSFRVFPKQLSDLLEYVVVVQFEESQ
jgi:hypothetical protein